MENVSRFFFDDAVVFSLGQQSTTEFPVTSTSPQAHAFPCDLLLSDGDSSAISDVSVFHTHFFLHRLDDAPGFSLFLVSS